MRAGCIVLALALLAAVAEHGLVTATRLPGTSADQVVGFVARHDPETDHLVGRDDLGRAVRLARVPAGTRACKD